MVFEILCERVPASVLFASRVKTASEKHLVTSNLKVDVRNPYIPSLAISAGVSGEQRKVSAVYV